MYSTVHKLQQASFPYFPLQWRFRILHEHVTTLIPIQLFSAILFHEIGLGNQETYTSE